MTRFAACVVAVALAACGADKPNQTPLSKEPVSVRGWIEDIEGATHSKTPEMETARRTQLFQATSVWIENAPYASGGVAENGAFIFLDVPPGNTTIGFNAPGAEQAQLVMRNIPGNADVFVPGLVLKKNGASVVNPRDLKVRVPAQVSKAMPTGRMAIIAGVQVPIVSTPLAEFVDRHDYPRPPGYRAVAMYK
ncbi:MAG TPA: hypothetical protein VGK31_09595 [Thermoanaerobaculia bacterium]